MKPREPRLKMASETKLETALFIQNPNMDWKSTERLREIRARLDVIRCKLIEEHMTDYEHLALAREQIDLWNEADKIRLTAGKKFD
jgi:hypothetical protein